MGINEQFLNITSKVKALFATQSESEAGTNSTKYMNPLRTKQAIDFNAPVTATTTTEGIVEKATAAEVLAETADKYPDSALLTNHPGVAKAWVTFDGTAVDGVADLTGVDDSYAIASVVDNGTGDYTVTLSNTMANANFVVTTGGRRATGASELDGEIQAWATSTTTFDVRTSSSSTGAQDWDVVHLVVHGDLA